LIIKLHLLSLLTVADVCFEFEEVGFINELMEDLMREELHFISHLQPFKEFREEDSLACVGSKGAFTSKEDQWIKKVQ
jgi:hypothetical protein